MSGCQNTETLSLCPHNVPEKFGCDKCLLESKFRNLYIMVDRLIERVKKLEDTEHGLSVEAYLKLLNRIEKLESKFKLKKCDACDGKGTIYWREQYMAGGTECNNCKGMGNVWG
jgi:hypothetical protein